MVTRERGGEWCLGAPGHASAPQFRCGQSSLDLSKSSQLKISLGAEISLGAAGAVTKPRTSADQLAGQLRIAFFRGEKFKPVLQKSGQKPIAPPPWRVNRTTAPRSAPAHPQAPQTAAGCISSCQNRLHLHHSKRNIKRDPAAK